MKIRIENNMEAVLLEVAKVEGKATTRTFELTRLWPAINKAEERLESMSIPKKYWTGCKISFRPPCVPNSYKHTAYGTEVTVERFPAGWFVVEIDRAYAGKKAYGGDEEERLTLSPVAFERVPKQYLL